MVPDTAPDLVAAVALPSETISCPLCGSGSSTHLFSQRDLALNVPGWFALVKCNQCGLIYQNPRVRPDALSRLYPPHYPAHVREPSLSRTLRKLGPSARWVLRHRLGYRHLTVDDVRAVDRVRGRLSRKRILKAFLPWVGRGRLLDVGCASGKFLRQMAAVGWGVAGIEFDAEAAAKARQVTPDIFTGDPTEAPFPPASFDVVTAFHVLEHLPNPLGALRNMLGWLAEGGLLVVEVPNVAGVGARLFGPYWSGLELPRHLTHFTPATMNAMVERAGGRIAFAVHKTKPRYVLRSLTAWLGDRPGAAARVGLTALTSRLGGGALKLLLELVMPIARPLHRGEAVRYFIRRR